MKKYSLFLSICAITALTGCVKEIKPNQDVTVNETVSASQSDNPIAQAASDHVQNEILIKFKEGTAEPNRQAILEKAGGKIKEHVLTKAMKLFKDNEGFYVVTTKGAAMEAISKVSGSADVEYVEPNYIYHHEATPIVSDSYYGNGNLWGMYGDATTPANKFGSQAGEAWALGNTGNAGVFVGVIDEGIKFDHPDLDGQIWTNPNDPIDGIDNDGNGYIDDVHGWDFANNDNSIYDGGTSGSADNHGTHVAGTIGPKPMIM